MTLGKLKKLLTENVVVYRNGKLAKEIIPRLAGKPIHLVAQEILESFIVFIEGELTETAYARLNSHREHFLLNTQKYLDTYKPFHKGDETGLLNRNNADALIISFINKVIAPMEPVSTKELF